MPTGVAILISVSTAMVVIPVFDRMVANGDGRRKGSIRTTVASLPPPDGMGWRNRGLLFFRSTQLAYTAVLCGHRVFLFPLPLSFPAVPGGRLTRRHRAAKSKSGPAGRQPVPFPSSFAFFSSINMARRGPLLVCLPGLHKSLRASKQ